MWSAEDQIHHCQDNHPFTPYSTLLLLLFFLLDLLLNLPVVLITVVSRKLQETYNIYLACLALADTLVAFNGLHAILWELQEGLSHKEGLCTFFKVYLHTTLLFSLVTLFLVALDRLLFIQCPFFYINSITPRRACVLMLSAWGLCLGYVLVMRFSDNSPDSRFCNGQCDVYTLFYQSQAFAHLNSSLFLTVVSMHFVSHTLIWHAALFQAQKLLSHGRAASARFYSDSRGVSLDMTRSALYTLSHRKQTASMQSLQSDDLPTLGCDRRRYSRSSVQFQLAPRSGIDQGLVVPRGRKSPPKAIRAGPILLDSVHAQYGAGNGPKWNNRMSTTIGSSLASSVEGAHKLPSVEHPPPSWAVPCPSLVPTATRIEALALSDRRTAPSGNTSPPSAFSKKMAGEDPNNTKSGRRMSSSDVFARSVFGEPLGRRDKRREPIRPMRAFGLPGVSEEVAMQSTEEACPEQAMGSLTAECRSDSVKKDSKPKAPPKPRRDYFTAFDRLSWLITINRNVTPSQLQKHKRAEGAAGVESKAGNPGNAVCKPLKASPIPRLCITAPTRCPQASPKISSLKSEVKPYAVPQAMPASCSLHVNDTSVGSLSPARSSHSTRSTIAVSRTSVMATIRLRIARKMVGVFLFLALCWLPFILMGFLGPQKVDSHVVAVTGYLVMVNSMANAVVYGWSNKDIRNAAQDALWWCRVRLLGRRRLSAS